MGIVRTAWGIGVGFMLTLAAVPAALADGTSPSGGPSPSFLKAAENRLYFATFEDVGGWTLWVVEDPDAGAAVVEAELGDDVEIVPVDDQVFFGTRGALWRGSPDGAFVVRDLDFFPTSLKNVDGVVYFSDGNGKLWRSGGTNASTKQIANILPASNDHDVTPAALTRAGTNVFFRANSWNGGTELWRTNGTVFGTTLVRDINAERGGGNPTYLRSLGTQLFFAGTSSFDTEFWTSDGTEAGTVAVKNINPAGSSYPRDIRDAGTLLFFSADDGTGRELFVSDGTPDGTVKTRDVNPTGGSFPAGLWPLDGVIFFRADDGTSGMELWKSDGTEAGTVQVADIHPTGASSPRHLRSIGTQIFFAADDGVHGIELWRTDGTTAGTTRVTDINPAGDALPRSLTPVDGTTLYFCAQDGVHGEELWAVTGCTENPAAACVVRRVNVPTPSRVRRSAPYLVKDVLPGGGDGKPYYLSKVGDRLYFQANDGPSGIELWRSDGTPGGTSRVVDLAPGLASSSPYGMTALGAAVIFSADVPGSGRELWATQGTAATTATLGDLNPGEGGSYPDEITVVGATAFFRAYTSANGDELWATDGTSAGTRLVKDIIPGEQGAFPFQLTAHQGALYFLANGKVWRSDGSEDGTVAIIDIEGKRLISTGPKLFLVTPKTPGSRPLLYLLDLGAGVARLVYGPMGQEVSTSPVPEFGAIGGDLLFGWRPSYGAPDFGRELYRSGSDGGFESATFVRALAPGNIEGDPRHFTAVGERVFFWATDETLGRELWVTDGTMLGTYRVRDIDPTNVTPPSFLTASNGKLFFSAYTPSFGRELWESDGTTVGTRLVGNINLTRSGYPEQLTDVNGTLFFYADDGVHGYELWAITPCGDGVVQPGEACDDGNLEDGDACNGTCRVATTTEDVRCSDERRCVPGTRLRVIDDGTLRVRLSSRTGAVLPGTRGAGGDPTIDGAKLVVSNPTTGEVTTFALPAAGWEAVRAKSAKGPIYRFSGAGDCDQARLGRNRLIARCAAGDGTLTLDEPTQGQLDVRVILGNGRLCLGFGGDVRKDSGRDAAPGVFLAKGAAAPTSCP